MRCVRGVYKLPTSNMSRDDANNVVTDDRIKLVWQDDSTTFGFANKKGWEDAIKHCEDLNFVGRDDWRLPNINELKTILDYSRVGTRAVNSKFQLTEEVDYWSSTRAEKDNVLIVQTAGMVVDKPKATNSFNVRCVADKK